MHKSYSSSFIIKVVRFAEFPPIRANHSKQQRKNNKMKNHYILKTCCERIFLIGSGNFWYKESEIGDDRTLLYRAYTTLLFSIYGFMTILEIMAVTMGEYPEDEKRDSISFAVSHTIVMMKIFSVIKNKSFIKGLNHKMVSVCESYEESALMAKKYKIMKMNAVAYIVTVYGSCCFFVFEGLRKLFAGKLISFKTNFWCIV